VTVEEQCSRGRERRDTLFKGLRGRFSDHIPTVRHSERETRKVCGFRVKNELDMSILKEQ
jgi:hypothetical protein